MTTASTEVNDSIATQDVEREALQHIVTLSLRTGVVSAGTVPGWEEYLGDLMTACTEASEWLGVNGVPGGPMGTCLEGQLGDGFDQVFSILAWHTGFDLATVPSKHSDRAEILNRELERGRWQ